MHRIRVVLLLRSGVEVVRVAAAPIATAVVDLQVARVPKEQRVSPPVSGAQLGEPRQVATPVAIPMATHAARPFPAVLRQPHTDLSHEILPRPCGLYAVMHQLISSELVTGQGLNTAAPPKL